MFKISSELGVSTDQVAIAWASTRNTVPIIGPKSLTQLQSNLNTSILNYLSIE
ncbi:aldo/keto reductase [Acinetobacter lactucae]|uniref:aldo/keto reductase n=1 Tax=Acinetobacter lactucae TaxID=1785128 RepID=UPI003709A24F|nr:aldo/keto reductase [Acinetobacter lactucae]